MSKKKEGLATAKSVHLKNTSILHHLPQSDIDGNVVREEKENRAMKKFLIHIHLASSSDLFPYKSFAGCSLLNAPRRRRAALQNKKKSFLLSLSRYTFISVDVSHNYYWCYILLTLWRERNNKKNSKKTSIWIGRQRWFRSKKKGGLHNKKQPTYTPQLLTTIPCSPSLHQIEQIPKTDNEKNNNSKREKKTSLSDKRKLTFAQVGPLAQRRVCTALAGDRACKSPTREDRCRGRLG